MATQKAAFTMRMQPKNLDKIKVLAAINKRSMAMQIEYLIEQYIKSYEKQNGEIHIADEEIPSTPPPDDVNFKFANANIAGDKNKTLIIQ